MGGDGVDPNSSPYVLCIHTLYTIPIGPFPSVEVQTRWKAFLQRKTEREGKYSSVCCKEGHNLRQAEKT